MAATVTEVASYDIGGGLKASVCTINLGTYATGGVTADVSSIFFQKCYGGRIMGNDGGYQVKIVPTPSTYAPATAVATAYYGDYDAGGDGAHAEVANSTNLATTPGTLTVLFVGE